MAPDHESVLERHVNARGRAVDDICTSLNTLQDLQLFGALGDQEACEAAQRIVKAIDAKMKDTDGTQYIHPDVFNKRPGLLGTVMDHYRLRGWRVTYSLHPFDGLAIEFARRGGRG